MSVSAQKSRQRSRTICAAGVLSIFMLCVVLFSAFFLAAESGHSCADHEHCPVCAAIEACERTLRTVGGSLLCAAIILPLAALLSVSGIRIFFQIRTQTLVSQKIRLNN